MLYPIVVAAVAAAGFIGSSLLALRGSNLTAPMRALAIAVAAGILLGLAFGDLFPESVELAERRGIAAFIAGFALLFLVEAFTHGHTHHSLDDAEHLHRHRVTPFIIGLGVHNIADGFAVGISTEVSETAAAAASIGILVHQIPVGLSVAAVLVAAHMPRASVVRAAVALGLLIPLAAAGASLLPNIGDEGLGMLIGVAGGVLAYIGASHLLPEAQSEHPSRTIGVVFTIVLLLTTAGIFTISEH